MLQQPLFQQESAWIPPSEFPNLHLVEDIALDTETRDEHLRTEGPGFIRGRGYMVGFSIATDDREWYFPVNHFDGGNLNIVTTLKWLRDVLSRTNLTVILHNAQYDMGWLGYHGIEIKGYVQDTQIRETLIHEEHPDGYSLDAIAKRRLGYKKDETLLRRAAETYGVDPKKDLWKLHSKYVGRYGEIDARLTYDIYQDQKRDLSEWNLSEIAELETNLIKPVFGMTQRGVRVDVKQANQLRDAWGKQETADLRILGLRSEDIWNVEALASTLRKHEPSLDIPRTPPSPTFPKGQTSVTNEFLEFHKDEFPTCEKLLVLRTLNRARKTFLEDKLLNQVVDGRIHAHFVQLAREEEGGGQAGTRTGRFSSNKPNLQQYPRRSKYVDTARIRHLFIPEDGYLWGKYDFNSQEPRIVVHYGLVLGLPGAKESKEAFMRGEKLYAFMERNSEGLDYDKCKQLVLAKSYGMGAFTLASSLGVSVGEAKAISEKFDQSFAYISIAASMVEAKAQAQGYIRTLCGRVRRFDYWEPKKIWDYKRELQKNKDPERRVFLLEKCKPIFGRDTAESTFDEPIQRAFTQKAFNSLIQGSAADQGKRAMLEISRQRCMSILHFPVHDEFNLSVPHEKEAEALKTIAEEAVQMKCPSKIDLDLGAHWK